MLRSHLRRFLATLLFGVVFLSPPILKKPILRWFCAAKIGRGVRLGWFSSVAGRRIEIGDHAEIRAATIIRVAGDVRIGDYTAISNFNLVYGPSSFTVGRHSYIGPQCLVNVDEDVTIGDGSALGPRSMVFTHGAYLPYTEGYWATFGPVTIGDNAWLAAGVFIQPGVTIGNEVFVNSMSVVASDVESGDVVEGFPARRATTVGRLRRTMTDSRLDAAARQMVRHFSELVLQKELGLAVADDGALLAFTYRRRRYLIVCMTSEQSAAPAHLDPRARVIFVSTHPNWIPPSPMKDALVVDLDAMRLGRAQDRIYGELGRFLRRYYGLRFEY